MLEETVAAPDRPHEALIGLTDALLSMPEQQRRAVLLREWKGLSHREIAEELGLTQAAVEALIFRGRRSLAAALENPEKRSGTGRYTHWTSGGAWPDQEFASPGAPGSRRPSRSP